MINWCSLVVADFWRQVVLKHAQVLNLVFNHKRLLVVQAQSREGGQRRGLVEHIQVADRELLSHALTHLERRALFNAAALVITELNAARTGLWLHWELHKLGRGRHSQRLVERVELLADLGELGCVDWHNGGVLGLGNGQVLHIQRDQVQRELGRALKFRILEN